MVFKKAALIGILSSLALLNGGFSHARSGNSDLTPTGKEVLKNLTDVEDMTPLPDLKLHAVQDKNGQLYIMTQNGRYLFGGLFFDIWAKKPLKNISEIRWSFSHLNPSMLGVNISNLAPISFGKGAKRVTVFVDPNCSWCHKLIKEIQDDQALQADYTFDFLVVPALGDDSARKAKLLHCTTEKDPLKVLYAFKNGMIEALPQPEKCDYKAFDERLVFAEIAGVTSVPYLISPDFRQTRGKPVNLRAWLEEGEKENERQAEMYRSALKAAAEKLMNQQANSKKAVPPQSVTANTAPSKSNTESAKPAAGTNK